MRLPPDRVLAAVLALPLVLTACGGGGASPESRIVNTTVSRGQQLIDLKHALDRGAITDKEYHREKRRILAGS